MTITRIINGKPIEIELTNQELYSAYFEAQHEMDIDDVICYLEDDDNEPEFTYQEISTIADISRRYQDGNDCIGETRWICLNDAVEKFRKGA